MAKGKGKSGTARPAAGSGPSTRTLCQPFWMPAFGPPPYPMVSAEMLMVEFEADAAEIARITPPPFEPAPHNRLVAFVANNMQLPITTSFHEAAILQRVFYQGREAITIPYIWVSNDTALIAGRDLYGMPKMLCDADTLHKSASEIVGRVSRAGTMMYELGFTMQALADGSAAPIIPDFAFVRHIPSPDPKVPALRQLIWAKLTDFKCELCLTGRGHIRLGNPMSSGLDRLAPGKVTGAWYGKFSWVLDAAEILFEDRVW